MITHLIVEAGFIIAMLMVGYGLFAALIVIGAQAFSSNDPTKPVPYDYDNRWPGFPLIPSDELYNPLTKGAFGKLPKQELQFAIVNQLYTEIWVDIV